MTSAADAVEGRGGFESADPAVHHEVFAVERCEDSVWASCLGPSLKSAQVGPECTF